MEIPMICYLLLSLFMFCCGLYGFITRKNMIAMLISLELMLNGVDMTSLSSTVSCFREAWRE